MFFPLSVCPGFAKPWAGLCAAEPVRQQPPVTPVSALPVPLPLPAQHSITLGCPIALGACQRAGGQLQVLGWTRIWGSAKRGVLLVELHQCVLPWWGSDVQPWQKAIPDVLPAVHNWFSELWRMGRQRWAQLGRAHGRRGGTCSSQALCGIWDCGIWDCGISAQLIPEHPHSHTGPSQPELP